MRAGVLSSCGLAAPIELQTEWLAECGQRPFGGIGFGDFERDVVHLTGRCPRPSPVPWPSRMTVAPLACTVIRTWAI